MKITNIKNSEDAMAALSENFNLLVTGKRKEGHVKEVNNTIGKMIGLVKTQVVDALRTGDKGPIPWLKRDVKELE